MKSVLKILVLFTVTFIAVNALASKQIDWSKVISVDTKYPGQPNYSIFNEREIEIKKIEVTNNKENLFIRLTADTNLEDRINFTPRPDSEAKFVADETLFTNLWFDTKEGGEENDVHSVLNGIDHHLMIDQRPSDIKLTGGKIKGVLFLTLSKYDDEGWNQMWETNTRVNSEKASVKGDVLEFTIPLKDITAKKRFFIKHCNSSQVFDPKYYTEIDYRVK